MSWKSEGIITLENGSVTGLDSKTGNVGNDFRSGLEDDEEHANGA